MIIFKGYFDYNYTSYDNPACLKMDTKLTATNFTVERSENNPTDCQVKNNSL